MVQLAKKWMADHYDEMIDDLKSLISCKSVKSIATYKAPFGSGVLDALKCVENISTKLGFNFNNMDGYIGYLDYEDTGKVPEVGILCHIDVVPPVNFTTNPFELVIRDGKMIARGIIDDKGPAIISLYALKALKESGFKPSKNIRLIFGCDEESSWSCIDYYKKHNKMPEIGFSPDADYPLINKEKGILSLVVKKEHHCKNIFSINGGTASNMVPNYCECIMDNEEKTTNKFYGKAVHASTPDLGDNAVIKALNSVRQIDSLFNQLYEMFKENNGSFLGLDDENITSNIGKFNYNDNNLEITIDLRYPENISSKVVLDSIDKVFHDYEHTVLHHMEPHSVDENHELCTKLLKAYQIETGKKGYGKMIGGGTYARAFKTGVAFGCVFENEPMMAHMADEYMTEHSFKLNCNIQLQGIYCLCK